MGNWIPGNSSGTLDSGQQALIGEAACVKWEQKLSSVGLCGLRVHYKMMNPQGVGSAADGC